MAATLFIEEESGTTSGRVHPHNGYYAWRTHDTPGTRASDGARRPATVKSLPSASRRVARTVPALAGR